jgi:hypothetical protein
MNKGNAPPAPDGAQRLGKVGECDSERSGGELPTSEEASA